MGRTLAELGETMTAAEFGLWVALYDSDPWDSHDDYGYGMICAAIANWAGKVSTKGTHLTPADFIPWLSREDVPEETAPDPLTFFAQFKKG